MNQKAGNLSKRNPVSKSDLPKPSPILSDPAILAGKPHIRGTRLSVEFLKGLLASGWTREKVLGVYQYLTPEDLDAVDLTIL